MRKRDTNCRPVSVRPSVTLVIQTAKNIIILVSWGRQVLPNSKGNQLSGGVKYTGWEKIAIFLTEKSRLSPKRYDIGQWLLWNVYRKL